MAQEYARHTSTLHQGGALSAVRAALEHNPRDPFQIDVCAVLDTLAATWGGTFDIAFANGRWRAQRRDRTGLILTCETPDELVRAMRGCGGAT